MTNDQSNILVSICCITYNHAPFIRKALDSFLMQEPPTGVSKDEIWYEILIHDDASTDGTTEIIKEYAAKYPDLIFPLYEIENQYKKVGTAGIDLYNYNRARGKYIAYCEGDDYWTDPNKLQKQVDFMESHQEYAICMHGCSVHDVRNGKHYESQDFVTYSKATDKNADGIDFTARDYFEGHYGQPLTMLFRLSMFDFDWHNRYKYYRDTHEIYHLLKAGKGYWMNFNGGVYVKHNGGIHTSGSLTQHMLGAIECVEELYIHNKDDKELRAYLKEILLWNHDVYKRERKANEFNKIIKPLWRVIPFVIVNVYWVIIKRILKSMISDENIRNDIFR